MVISTYNNHIAYRFEDKESISPLGSRVMSRMNKDYLMKYYQVTHNGNPKLLYGTENLRRLDNVIANLAETEVIAILKQLIEVVCTVNDNDYMELGAIDINFTRLYYNEKQKLLKCIILPINEECDFHENVTWHDKLRNTLCILCSHIFRGQQEKYSEMYFLIMDKSRTDIEIINELDRYDFEITKIDDVVEVKPKSQGNCGNAVMFLEHISDFGDIIFKVSQKEYIIGKSIKNADGVVTVSTSVSRKHCIIRQRENFTIEDLGSSNGTSVNGYRIEPGVEYILNDGDEIQLADVLFNVRIEW